MTSAQRWGIPGLRRWLCPPNRLVLDPWIAREASALDGLVLNVGAGEDQRQFGRRTIRVDAFAPRPSVRADFTFALPFVSRAFDAAICTEVLEHVPDERALVLELARVLKPGARLVVTVPFMYRYHPDPADFRRFTPDGLAALLTRAGFTVERGGGLGGAMLALILWIDAIHVVPRLLVRVLLLPFRPLGRGRLRASWSVLSANAVAVARREPE